MVSLGLSLSGCQELYLEKSRNDAPEITIVAPTPSASYRAGDLVEFRAVPTDDEDIDRLVVTWYLDEAILCEAAPPDATGNSTCTLTMEQGMTTVMAEARDAANAIGTDQRDFEVLAANVAPTCEVLFPTDDATAEVGALVTLLGSSEDVDGSTDALQATWTSSMDGLLGSSALGTDSLFSFSIDTLSEGVHTITLQVLDALGASCEVSAMLDVGSSPTVEILAPEAGEAFQIEQDIPWSAQVSDDVTAAPDLVLAWNSDLDGTLEQPVAETSGAIQGLWTLSEGTHTLTLSAEDQAGRQGSDSVQIIVERCSPNAVELPYDGIDSNCDGLEALNDSNGDGIPDDMSLDYDIDDDIDTSDAVDVPARLGLECAGTVVTSIQGRSFYLLTCDDDRYWQESEAFCEAIGYDSLAAHDDPTMMQQHADLVILLQSQNEAAKLAGTLHEDVPADDPWVGLTRGPSCEPATGPSLYPEVCTADVRGYYWTNTTVDDTWIVDDLDAAWHDCEMASCDSSQIYINPSAGDYTSHNGVEHCAFLLIDGQDTGYFDLYCELVSGTHEQWSATHTRSSSCIREITP
jgi:hypothetical protein